MDSAETALNVLKVERYLAEMVEIVIADPRRVIQLSQVEEWASNLSNQQFFNLVALIIAEKYAAGTLNYQVCDAIMNDLWGAWLSGVEADPRLPCPFYEIYEAFDAGEYHRCPRQTDDPVKDYTDPWIAEILSRSSHRLTR